MLECSMTIKHKCVAQDWNLIFFEMALCTIEIQFNSYFKQAIWGKGGLKA